VVGVSEEGIANRQTAVTAMNTIADTLSGPWEENMGFGWGNSHTANAQSPQ